ncbi:MAG TPA: cytochrome c [Chitinophagaceae bacterium]|nr:cytochrome c [Chitinophagaceae bacterium]
MIKKVFLIPILSLLVACAGCGNNSGNNAAENQPTANGSPDSSTMAGAPAVDVTAKSDSKGVGRFTDVKVGPLDTAMASKGAALFQSKCTVCHKTTEEKLIGPGLKGITLIRTPEWIMNMITDPNDMTENDPVASTLLSQYHTQMTVQTSDQEAREILEFLRGNDGAK